MRVFAVLSFLFLTICGTAASDSIEVLGQFEANHTGFPKTVKLVSPSGNFEENTNVGTYGNFKFSFARPAMGFYVFQTANYSLAFPIGPSESTYRLRIYGDSIVASNILVENSKESEAFTLLKNASAIWLANLRVEMDKCIQEQGDWQNIYPLIDSCKKAAAQLLKNYPNTYAQTLAGLFDFKIPETKSRSKKNLQDNFLNHIQVNDPLIYNNIIIEWLFDLYASHLLDIDSMATDKFVRNLYEKAKGDSVAVRNLSHFLINYFLSTGNETALACLYTINQGRIAFQDPVLNARMAQFANVLPGKPAKDFYAAGLNDHSISLSDFATAHRLTVLLFYSHTCEHCLEFIPRLKQITDSLKNPQMGVFAVDFDSDKTGWKKFVHNNALPFTHAFLSENREAVSNDYAIISFPTIILIDENMNLISRFGTIEKIIKAANFK